MTWRSWASFWVGLWWPFWWLCLNVALPLALGWCVAAGIAFAFVLLSIGCACGNLPPVAPPGEPKMVLEAEGRVRLAAFDESKNEFIDLGWHDAAGLRGWTIADYDWSLEP